MKVAVVTQRAEVKDYLDIHALLTKAKIPLPQMLAAGAIVCGLEFDPLSTPLKAVAVLVATELAGLPTSVRHDLIKAVQATDTARLPALKATRKRLTKP